MPVPFVPLADHPRTSGLSEGSLYTTIVPAPRESDNDGLWMRALTNFLGNAAGSAVDYGLKDAFSPEYSGEQLNQILGTGLPADAEYDPTLAGLLGSAESQRRAQASAEKLAGEGQAFDLNLEDIRNRDAIMRQESALAASAAETDKKLQADRDIADQTRRYGAKTNFAKFLGDQNQSDYMQLVDLYNNPYLSPEERAALQPHLERAQRASGALQQFFGAEAGGDPNTANRYLNEFQNMPGVSSAPQMSPKEIFMRRALERGVPPEASSRMYDDMVARTTQAQVSTNPNTRSAISRYFADTNRPDYGPMNPIYEHFKSNDLLPFDLGLDPIKKFLGESHDAPLYGGGF